MARRAHFVVALVMALIGLASLPVAAQSGRTFYIDYASGSNSNAGTKAFPWKTHPYMRTGAACTNSGLPPAYSHQAGDYFIFMGGVTWPAACLPLIIGSGGSSASTVSGAGAAPTINGADYYGVDVTWYSGGSFTKPVFDAQGTTPAGLYGAIVEVTANYVTLDDLEMKNALQAAVTFAQCARGSIDLGTSTGVVIDRLYIHDWSIGSLANQDGSWHAQASICGNIGGTYSGKVYNTEMSDAAQPAGSQFGTCFIGLGEVAYSNCHNVAEGQLYSYGPTHDNYFHDFDGNTAMAPSGAHSNGIESGAIAQPSAFYNNYMYNLDVGYNEICPGTAVYNNVFSKIYNSGAGGGQELAVDAGDPGCAYATPTTQTYIYNNTFDAGQAGGSYSTVRLTARPGKEQGVVTLKNNINIGGSLDLSGATQTPVQSNNYTMSTSEATTYGFTPANKYDSTSSDPNVESQGVDLLSSNLLSSLSASLINLLQPLAQDPEGAPWFGGSYIARGASWDLGAYVFGGQSSSGTSKPNPPTNLTATVQ